MLLPAEREELEANQCLYQEQPEIHYQILEKHTATITAIGQMRRQPGIEETRPTKGKSQRGGRSILQPFYSLFC